MLQKYFFWCDICFFYLSNMRNWGFECTASADTVCREGTGKEGRGSKMGGGGLTLKEFQESFFSATNLNYWKCKLNFLKHLLNSKEMKHVQSLSKKLLILLLSFFPVRVLFIVGVLKFIIALYLYVIRQSVCYCFVFKFLLLSSLVVLFLIL